MITPTNSSTETRSINECAKHFLKLVNKPLPTKLHSALNTVFTKPRDDDKPEIKAFRKRVIVTVKGYGNDHYQIMSGKANAIYNALCLIAIVGVGPTKKIFQYAVQTPKKTNVLTRLELNPEQALIFFCLGVQSSNLASIEALLLSDNFDLFSQKLPSPFSVDDNDQYNLTPMLAFFDKKIPWPDYVADYQCAAASYEKKAFDLAKLQLAALKEKAVIPLPVVTALSRRIAANEKEADEAFTYIQSLLNSSL